MRKSTIYTLGFFLFGCYQSSPILLEIERDSGVDGAIAEEDEPRLPDRLIEHPNPSLSEVAEAAMKVYLLWQRARCTCNHGPGECPWGVAEEVNPEATQCLAGAARGDDDFFRWLYQVATSVPRYLSCTEGYEICPGTNSGGRCYDHDEFEFLHLFSTADEYKVYVKEYNECVGEALKVFE